MKTILLVAFVLLGSSLVQAQSLKEALYGGKLKADTGATVKKGDSLKIKENMARKLADDSLKKEAAAAAASLPKEVKADSVGAPTTVGVTTTTTDGAVAPVTATTADPVKDNNRIWKQFVDEYTTVIKAEVMPSKKIKNGTYSVLIEYEIGIDGYVTTQNIYVSPENKYLAEQVKLRMMANAPQLNPVLLSNGKPRKALKKQSLTLVKEKD